MATAPAMGPARWRRLIESRKGFRPLPWGGMRRPSTQPIGGAEPRGSCFFQELRRGEEAIASRSPGHQRDESGRAGRTPFVSQRCHPASRTGQLNTGETVRRSAAVRGSRHHRQRAVRIRTGANPGKTDRCRGRARLAPRTSVRERVVMRRGLQITAPGPRRIGPHPTPNCPIWQTTAARAWPGRWPCRRRSWHWRASSPPARSRSCRGCVRWDGRWGCPGARRAPARAPPRRAA